MEKTVWSNEEMIARFGAFWDNRPRSVAKHSEKIWDRRAAEWKKSFDEGKERSLRNKRRVEETVRYLTEQGVLLPETESVDIGCGLGRFSAEIARQSKHALGLDYSPQMIEYARQYAEEQHITNVDYRLCDFKTADIDREGWRSAFDLVFTSITPAVSRRQHFEKAMAMSRKWCFSALFADYQDFLLAAVSEKLYGRPPAKWRDGASSYAVFNLLWLQGYSPYVHYYTEDSSEMLAADRETAAQLAEEKYLCGDNEPDIEAVYRFLCEHADDDGGVRRNIRRKFIWLLWDATDRMDRSSYDR